MKNQNEIKKIIVEEDLVTDNALIQFYQEEGQIVCNVCVSYIDIATKRLKTDEIGIVGLYGSFKDDTTGYTCIYGNTGNIVEYNNQAIAYSLQYTDWIGEKQKHLLSVYDLKQHNFISSELKQASFEKFFNKSKTKQFSK